MSFSALRIRTSHTSSCSERTHSIHANTLLNHSSRPVRVRYRPTSRSLHTVALLLNNEKVLTKESLPLLSPVTGKPLWEYSRATENDARRAVDSAATAFHGWSQTKAQARRDIFLRAAELLQQSRDELSKCIVDEIAASESWAGFNISLATQMVKEVAGRITSVSEGVLPETIGDGVTALVYKKPYGVVVGIAPWNAPLILGIRSILFPLAVGNTVVLKCSEHSPKTHTLIGDIFRQAGLPSGCLNTIIHGPQDGARITEALISHPAVGKVNFTGSTATGHKIAEISGRHGKPVLLELGGKAPMLVFKDADLDKAASAAAWGGNFAAGQVCMSTDRLLVEESIHDEFIEKLKHVLGTEWRRPFSLVLANGAMKVRALVQDALDKGASLAYGVQSTLTEEEIEYHHKKTTLPGPTLVAGVTKEMDINRLENFGPVMSVMAFKGEEEGIKLANDTTYGLSASVWTKDLAKGIRVAQEIVSGAVHLNAPTIHDEAALPHGGFKHSGFGRFGGSWGLNEFLTTKTITFSYKA